MCCAFFFLLLIIGFHFYELEIYKQKWLHFLFCAAEVILAILTIIFGIIGTAQGCGFATGARCGSVVCLNLSWIFVGFLLIALAVAVFCINILRKSTPDTTKETKGFQNFEILNFRKNFLKKIITIFFGF